MAIALTPDAYLSRSPTAWDVYFSWCGWRRIDVDRAEFTVLAYLGGNIVGGGGFQFTVDASRQLIIYRANDFADLLGGTGPTLAVDEWWFLGITTIAADEADNVVLYYAKEGDASLTEVTVSYSGAYQYQQHWIGARPGADGSGGAYRLHGSAAHDRSWQNRTLTPAEMLAEFQSSTVANGFEPWAVWPMADAATATEDATVNDHDLTLTTGTGSIATTGGPDFGTAVEGTAAATWGPWSGTAAGDVEAGVTEGLAEATWGPWTATASGQITEAVTSGTAAGTWGPWSGTADGQVITDIVGGTASATWGPWTAAALGEVTERKTDITVKVGPTRDGRGLVVGPSRTSWTVGPTRIDRGP